MDRSMLRSFAVAGLLTFFSTLAAAEEAPSNQAISGERDFNLYCASCHGESGNGDGPKAAGLEIRTPDLTTLTARYGTFPAERLRRMIDGREDVKAHGDRDMPVWGVWFKAEAAEELGGAEGMKPRSSAASRTCWHTSTRCSHDPSGRRPEFAHLVPALGHYIAAPLPASKWNYPTNRRLSQPLFIRTSLTATGMGGSTQ